jgi:hypothetical protein
MTTTEQNESARPDITAPTEDLGKIAEWLEGRARWLRHEREVQMRIDPEWTIIELKPEAFENLADGIEKTVAVLKSIVAASSR